MRNLTKKKESKDEKQPDIQPEIEPTIYVVDKGTDIVDIILVKDNTEFEKYDPSKLTVVDNTIFLKNMMRFVLEFTNSKKG